MSNEIMRREMIEAINAGESALEKLKLAQEKLNSASNWGILDILGGGFISTMMKRSKMEEANRIMEEARVSLWKFQEELDDVQLPMELKVEVGSFLSFADYFFDGVVADFMVQSKISDAKLQVSDTINRVQHILNKLSDDMTIR